MKVSAHKPKPLLLQNPSTTTPSTGSKESEVIERFYKEILKSFGHFRQA